LSGKFGSDAPVVYFASGFQIAGQANLRPGRLPVDEFAEFIIR
jgi:hypothetical protein